ncbi:MAG: hypothetical protein CME34_22750 [Gordonia sp.]|uniref:hypothetical protein n=1 Tax=Gordonia sp. (in: high G+C Gram-positive bacteria) TaxID=84139 RepID=UPI000C36CC1A|nr:hypothetical protein [Gordonia sp. (in: high G+C Gram-positive bacteria)]MAU84631.1 hypothetical protein [Gordonia sp. (in: high G+C Gram-positive bacteria)]
MNEKERRATEQKIAALTRALEEYERLPAAEREAKPWYRDWPFVVLTSLAIIFLGVQVVLLAIWAIDQLPIGG